MSLEHFLEAYGYPVLFLGTLLEGETPILMASFLAHRGYFDLPMVVLVAFAGTFAMDQLVFHLGRTRGRELLSRRPGWQAKAARAGELLAQHGAPLVIGFRFLYGLRTVTPFVIGMSGFGRARFFFLNALGGILWSVAISVLGYAFGSLVASFLEHARRYEIPVLLTMLLLSALAWSTFLVRQRLRARR